MVNCIGEVSVTGHLTFVSVALDTDFNKNIKL